jgi:hypothetical protein
MLQASEIEPVAAGVFLWRYYDPSVKADLFSTALETSSGIYLVDPIRLAPEAIAGLTSRASIAGVIVTNENHERSAARFAERFTVPIYLDHELATAEKAPEIRSLRAHSFPPELTPVTLDGGPPGETAIHFADNDGTMVIGDALINFEPYGFTLLPAKYCSNFKRMRASLSKLLNYSFERMLFAHGTPLVSGARARLEMLLKERC